LITRHALRRRSLEIGDDQRARDAVLRYGHRAQGKRRESKEDAQAGCDNVRPDR